MARRLPGGAGPHTLIVGVGPGIGAAVARRFAHEGFVLTLLARHPERLDALAGELRAKGASVSVAAGDADDPAALSASLARISETAGPGVGVYNAAYL
jgi:short-subunit dehydrogenase